MSVSLPLGSDSIRCSDFSRLNELDPGGTAMVAELVVVVEIGEPWPKPVGKHPGLVELVAKATAHPEQVRLLAAVPHDPTRPRIIGFRRIAGGMTRSEVVLGSHPVSDLLTVLHADIGRDVVGPDATRTVLVCTQGSYDVCCGADGGAFADDLVAAQPELEVFRVSHTGGHRFAPTAMTLPDGRMWAYLTRPVMDQLLDRTLPADRAAELCRGWWGAPTGPAQIAERAVFAQVGWELDQLDRRTSVEQAADGRHRVSVDVDIDTWSVLIEHGREVPTIACEAPGGLPAKPGRELTVASGPVRVG